MNFYADEYFLFQRIIRPAAPRAGMPGRYVKSGALSRNKKKFYRVNCGKLIFILGKPILMRMETFCLSATLLLKFFFKPYSRFFSPSIQGGSVFLPRDPRQITNPHTPSHPHPHTHLLTPPTPACALPERPGGSPCVRPPLTSWGQHLRKRANRQIWESSKQTDLGNEQTGRFGKRANR